MEHTTIINVDGLDRIEFNYLIEAEINEIVTINFKTILILNKSKGYLDNSILYIIQGEELS